MSEMQSGEAVGRPRLASLMFWVAVVMGTLGMGSAAGATPTIVDIKIVEVVGRPGHAGFFPIQGDPIVGSLAAARARLSRAANGVTLNLRDSTQTLVGQVPMTAAPADGWPAGTYFTEFQVPTIPFSLSVSGTDENGSFEIAPSSAGVVSPQTVAVRLLPTVAEVPAGIPLYVTVQVTNYGASDTYAVALTGDNSATVAPVSVPAKLDSNQTVGAQFQVTVPAGISGAFTLTLRATATSSAPGGSTNRAVLELPIATRPAESLAAWVRPNDKRDLTHLDKDSLINVWVCDTGVNGNSISVVNAVPPVQVQHLGVAPQDRKACGAPAAFELTFKATDLVAALTNTGLSAQKNREIQVPLAGYRPNGTPLIGYVPLLF
jgi:hypothetical protein